MELSPGQSEAEGVCGVLYWLQLKDAVAFVGHEGKEKAIYRQSKDISP
jgi:hypothetical protein